MKTALMGQLKKGHSAKVLKILPGPFSKRLLEMGVLEGSVVELLHEAPFSQDPIAIGVCGSVIALRR